jgi:Zn-finger domain associated with topoisomerase type I
MDDVPAAEADAMPRRYFDTGPDLAFRLDPELYEELVHTPVPAPVPGQSPARLSAESPQTPVAPVIGFCRPGVVQPFTAQTCPECGAPMVLQQALRAEFSAGSFWGCVRFPICGAVVPAKVPGLGNGVSQVSPFVA